MFLGTLVSLQMVTPYLVCPVQTADSIGKVLAMEQPLFSIGSQCDMNPVFVERDVNVRVLFYYTEYAAWNGRTQLFLILSLSVLLSFSFYV